jgi:hypothetical protein
MERTLRIVADTPSDDPRMGFESYAEALAAAIRGGEPPQFTIGIYGAWGSGKSSLLNAIARRFEGEDRVIPVQFDAWRYERAEHIAVPLLHAVHQELARRDEPEVLARVGQALRSLVKGLTFNLGVVSFDAGSVADDRVDHKEVSELDSAYYRPYADMRRISEALDGRRIVILVDDLDRCSPSKVVGVLEAINLVLDVPGFIFVLALDYEVLVKAVTTSYPHASGHVFIEKMIQVPFRVPRLNLSREEFLADLIPHWELHRDSLPQEFGETAFDVCTMGLNANPRQIKRFVNSVYVLSHVAESAGIQVDPRLLSGVVGLQLRWPSEYQDLSDGVFASDADPLASVLNADDPALQRYASRFFDGVDVDEHLRAVLMLTQSVAAPDAVSGYETGDYESLQGNAEDLRRVHRAEIEERFAQLGIETEPRFPHTYYHARIKNCRVKFGKTVVRVEAKSKEGRWLLVRSFLLTREHEECLRLLGDEATLAQAVGEIGAALQPG